MKGGRKRRVRLTAEGAAAVALSKVYEDAIREDNEQYLGSDDPDNEFESAQSPNLKKGFQDSIFQGTSSKEREQNKQLAAAVDLKRSVDPARRQLPSTLNPDAPEFPLPISSLQHVVKGSGRGTMNHVTTEREDCTPTRTKQEPQSSFWEKKELRMSQPPPSPSPFEGDPAQYLWFRANFSDQVESKTSLSDSEKMNYLMGYTTGRAQRVIENYQGLLNGCQLALEVLKQRFAQNGPRIKAGDSGALLAQSDKIQNCCWAMTELQSSELN